MFVTFLCGCETKEILTRENIKTMDTVAFDTEGFLICKLHRERRQGWRSVPVHPEVSNVRIKKSYLGHNPLVREAHIVFGEDWPELMPLKLDFKHEPDKRDARDPHSIYEAVERIKHRSSAVLTFRQALTTAGE